MDWVTPLAFIVALFLALFIVPRAARRIERESFRRASPSEREGWYHPHVDRDRKEPKRKHTPREPESEEHSP